MVVLDLKLFSETLVELSLFSPETEDRCNRSQLSKVVYKAGSCDCNAFHIGKIKRRLHDRKTVHFKVPTSINHSSAVADYITLTSHRIKWDHFDISATGREI